MTNIEMVQEALSHCGEVPNQELAAYVQQQHGVTIKPNTVMLIRASIRQKERTELLRLQAKAAIERAVISGGA